VALNGWVVSSVSEYELTTSVGGSRGFSGLGYVNVDEMLTVIVNLVSRNPRATGVAAWVVEEKAAKFVKVTKRYPNPCVEK
jgi:hypothetical protein